MSARRPPSWLPAGGFSQAQRAGTASRVAAAAAARTAAAAARRGAWMGGGAERSGRAGVCRRARGAARSSCAAPRRGALLVRPPRAPRLSRARGAARLYRSPLRAPRLHLSLSHRLSLLLNHPAQPAAPTRVRFVFALRRHAPSLRASTRRRLPFYCAATIPPLIPTYPPARISRSLRLRARVGDRQGAARGGRRRRGLCRRCRRQAQERYVYCCCSDSSVALLLASLCRARARRTGCASPSFARAAPLPLSLYTRCRAVAHRLPARPPRSAAAARRQGYVAPLPRSRAAPQRFRLLPPLSTRPLAFRAVSAAAAAASVAVEDG